MKKGFFLLLFLSLYLSCSHSIDQPAHSCELDYFNLQVAAKSTLSAAASDCEYVDINWQGVCLMVANMNFDADMANARWSYNDCLSIQQNGMV